MRNEDNIEKCDTKLCNICLGNDRGASNNGGSWKTYVNMMIFECRLGSCNFPWEFWLCVDISSLYQPWPVSRGHALHQRKNGGGGVWESGKVILFNVGQNGDMPRLKVFTQRANFEVSAYKRKHWRLWEVYWGPNVLISTMWDVR